MPTNLFYNFKGLTIYFSYSIRNSKEIENEKVNLSDIISDDTKYDKLNEDNFSNRSNIQKY